MQYEWLDPEMHIIWDKISCKSGPNQVEPYARARCTYPSDGDPPAGDFVSEMWRHPERPRHVLEEGRVERRRLWWVGEHEAVQSARFLARMFELHSEEQRVQKSHFSLFKLFVHAWDAIHVQGGQRLLFATFNFEVPQSCPTDMQFLPYLYLTKQL